MFKIFYSWQSDLKKTRYFIRDCIDLAIDLARETETIDALRDEATKDVTGSPNIVQTLLSKIDDCDMFIADVSMYYKSDDGKRKSPNPNVLIELGYAMRALGDSRIICILDTATGKPEELPFDIRQNRILNYSFESKTRTEAKHELAEAICCDIRKLQNEGVRIRDGESQFAVGTYDEVEGKVIQTLRPTDFEARKDYRLIQEYTEKAKQLIIRINELSAKIESDNAFEEKSCQMMGETDKGLLDFYKTSGISDLQKSLKNIVASGDIYGKNTNPVVAYDPESAAKWMRQYCDFNPSVSFFDFGSLTETNLQMGFDKQRFLNGTDAEKAKDKSYRELYRALYQIWIHSEYIHSFDGLLFFPIAIQNISTINDDNIRIVIELEKGTAVNPTKELIVDAFRNERGRICRFGLVDKFLHLPHNPMVEIEYSPEQQRNATYHFTIDGYEKNKETEDDYGANLQQYVLMPIDSTHYNASISNLRPKEAMWLSGGMLIKPDDGRVKIRYTIHSTLSSGEINGVLEYTE